MIDLNFWITVTGRLLAGSLLLLGIAMALGKLARSPWRQRAVWQGALAAAALFGLAELAGFNWRSLARGTEVQRPAWTGGRVVVEEIPTAPAAREIAPAATALPAQVAAPPRNTWWPAVLWLGGFAFLIGLRVFQSAICYWIKSKADPAQALDWAERIAKLQARMGHPVPVKIIISPCYRTPVAFGLLSPSIGLPAGFANEFSAREQDSILAHELAHLAHHDPLWRLLSDLLCAALWWNPAAWVVRRQFLDACELAADERSAGLGDGQVLAEALVLLANRISLAPRGNWSGMAGGGYRSNLGRRVKWLLEQRPATGGRKIAQAFSAPLSALVLFISLFFGIALAEQKAGAFAIAPGESPFAVALEQILSPAVEVDSRASRPLVQSPAVPPEVPPVSNGEQLISPPASPVAEKVEAKVRSENSSGQPAPEEKPVVPRVEISAVQPAAEPLQAPAASSDTPPQPATPQPAAADTQIMIEAKWAEVSNLDPLDFQGVPLSSLLPAIHARKDLSTGADADFLQIKPGLGWVTNDIPQSTIVGSLSAVLAPADYSAFVKILEQREGVDLLSAPKVTTLSGRQARISITETRTIVTGVGTNTPLGKKEAPSLITEQMEFGTFLDVFPLLQESGQISLRVQGEVREFLGYVDPKSGEVRPLEEASKWKGNPPPMPRIRVRSYDTEAKIAEGETLMLCGIITPQTTRFREKVPVLGDVPMLGRLFRSERSQTSTRHLILLITAKRVSATGL